MSKTDELKYWTVKHIVQILYEKPLGAAIWSYLWVPYVSKILSQDKKIYAKFRQIFSVHEFFSKQFLCDDLRFQEQWKLTWAIFWNAFLSKKNLANFFILR